MASEKEEVIKDIEQARRMVDGMKEVAIRLHNELEEKKSRNERLENEVRRLRWIVKVLSDRYEKVELIDMFSEDRSSDRAGCGVWCYSQE